MRKMHDSNINFGYYYYYHKALNKHCRYLSVSKCESPWFEVEGLCFRVYAGNTPYHWSEARYLCIRKGGDLAVVDSELKRRTIAYRLNNMRHSYPRIYRVYIGLCKLVTWKWLGGSSISSNYWHRGELDDLKFGECALVMRRSYAWKLAKGQCSQHGFLCETNERKYFERKATFSHFPNISMIHFFLIVVNTFRFARGRPSML